MSLLKSFLFVFIFLVVLTAKGQVGVGLYPSGTEPGISFKTSKVKPVYADIRFTDFFFSDSDHFKFKSEVLVKRRFTYFERINFVVGVGPRMEYYSNDNLFYGVVAPLAVEAFPFPFPNAGLFFEVGPYYTTDFSGQFHGGFRTASGINFYFVNRKISNVLLE
jgi:hypothetical protein